MAANQLARNNRTSSYTRNLGKQFGYAVGDVFSTYAPTSSSIIKSSRSLASNVRRSMNKMNTDQSSQATRNISQGLATSTTILDDLANGKFFDNDVEPDSTGRRSSAEDWGDDDTSGIAQAIAQNEASTKDLISSVGRFSTNVSKAIGISNARSAEYIARSNANVTKALYDLNKQGFNQVSSILLNIDSTLANVASLGTPLTAHMQNSAIFYANTTDSLNKISESLKNIEKNTDIASRGPQGKYKKQRGSSDRFMSNGYFDMEAYLKMVKENFKEQQELFQTTMFGKITKQQKQQGMLGMALDMMMPTFMKSSVQMFDESLRNIITSSLSQAGIKAGKSNNPLAQLLGSIFLPRDGYKNGINTGNYQKGQVAWDGIARKSLTEVIPTYLAKIYAALGGEEKYYDYEIGKFVSARTIKGKHDYDISEAAKRAGGDYRKDALKKAGNPEIEAEIERYFLNAFKNGDSFIDANRNNKSKHKKNNNISDEAYEILVSLLEDYGNASKSKYNSKDDRYLRNRGSQFAANVASGRNEIGKKLRLIEANGTSNLNYLYNGFGGTGNLKQNGFVDKYNNTSLDYLRGIYTLLGQMGGSGKSKKKFKLGKISDNPTQAQSTSSEKSNMDNNINYKYYGMTEEDVAIQNQRKNSIKEYAKVRDKFLASESDNGWEDKKTATKRTGAIGKIQNIYNAPFVMLTDFLDTATDSLNSLFWGKNGEDGLIDRIYNKFDETSSSLTDKLSSKLNSWFSELGFVKGIKEQVKTAWGNVKTRVSTDARNLKNRVLYGKTASQNIDNALNGIEAVNNGTAARGRKVTKSGVVVVSEGELIIPSEYNPYYNGVTNKAKQIRNERNIAGKFFGLFHDGGTVGVEFDENGENPKFYQTEGDHRVDITDTLSKAQKRFHLKKFLKEQRDNGKSKLKDSFKNADFSGAESAAQVIGQGSKMLTGGITKFISECFGKDPEQEKGKVFKVLESVKSDAGNNMGNMAIGAMAGAGVSLLTGAVVGPLAGAALGAGTSLVLNSEKVQHALFGYTDENGNFQEGMFKKSWGEAVKKYAPSVLEGGGAGLIAGTLMGSPLLGAFAGAALGYASKSDRFSEFLFGNEDRDGLISKNLQAKLKEKAPRLAAGAMAGALIGPFGMLPNLMLGAGLGYVSDSEEFHNFMFGEKDGIASIIRNKVVYNLDDIFHNLKNTLIGSIRKFVGSIGQKVTRMGASLAKKLNKVVSESTIGKKALGLAGAAVRAPLKGIGTVLDAANTGTKKFNLNRGYDVYDRKLGRNLNAQERTAMRLDMGAKDGTWSKFDNIIGDADEDELKRINSLLSAFTTNNKGAQGILIEDSISQMLNGFGRAGLGKDQAKLQNKISNLVRSGKIDEAKKLLSGAGLDDSQLETAMGAMSKADAAIKNAKSNLQSKENIRGILKGMGINFSDGDAKNAIASVENELSSRFSKDKKEENEKADEVDYKTNVVGILNSIDLGLKVLSKHQEFTLVGKWKQKVGAKKIGKLIAENEGSLPDFFNTSDDENHKVEFDNFGNVHQYIKNNQGEWVEDDKDNETKESTKKMTQFMDSVTSIPGIGAAIGGVTGMLGGLKDKLIGDEKEPGLLSKLFSGLLGEEGVFGGLLGLFTGESGGIKGILKTAISNPKILLKGMFTNVLGPALLAAGLGGKFDQLASDITNDAYNEKSQKESTTYTATTKNGTEIHYHYDKDGNMVNDETGETVNPDDIAKVNKTDTGRRSFSDAMKYNIGRGIATNTKNIGSAVMGKTAVGKGVSKAISSVGKDAAELAAKGGLIDDVLNGIGKFTSALRKIPALNGFADKLDDLGLDLCEKVGAKLSSESAKSLASFASTAVVWIKAAFIVADFTTGYEDARTTLGIVKEPTTGQRILSGLLRAIKNFIPIIGTLIPDSLIIDVFCDHVAGWLGIDVSELKKSREEAENTVNDYNAKNGTNYSVGDFNKSVLKDYTWTERLGNGAKTTWEDTKLKFSHAKSAIKEKGLGGAIKDGVSNMAAQFMNSYKDNGGGMAGFFGAMGDSFQSLLPGVFGDIAKANEDIKKFAYKGELGNLWKVSFVDEGGEAVEGTDLTTAAPSLMTKILGQIPLVTTKLAMTPVGIINKGINLVKEPLINLGKSAIEGYKNGFKDYTKLLGLMTAGDIEGLWTEEPEDEEGNPLGGIYKVSNISNKVLLTVPTVISWLGHKVWDGIKKVGTDGKEVVTAIGASFGKGWEVIHKTDGKGNATSSLSEFLDFSDTGISDDNIFRGIGNTAVIGSRILAFPVAAGLGIAVDVGNKVKAGVTKVKNGVVHAATAITDNDFDLGSYAVDGDWKGYWANQPKDDPENPLNGIMGGINFIRKLTMSPLLLFHMVGNKVKAGVTKVKNGVVHAATAITDNDFNLANYAVDGDWSGYWSNQVQDDPENPLNGVMGAVNFTRKLSMSPLLLFHMAGNKIKEKVNSAKEKVITAKQAIDANSEAINEAAKNGDWSGVWKNDVQDDPENPINGIMGAVNFAQKLANTPSVLFHMVGNKVHAGIQIMTDSIKEDQNKFSTTLDKMKKYAGDGDVVDLLKTDTNIFNATNPFSYFFRAGLGITKAFNTVTGIVNAIVVPIKEGIKKLQENIDDMLDNDLIKGALAGVATVKAGAATAYDGVSSAAQGAANGAKKLGDKIYNWGAEKAAAFGGGSGFVSQYDPRYSNKQISGTTFADKGCGPAVAAMAGGMSVDNALSRSNKYQNPNGVTLDYFQDVFDSRGMNSQVITGGSSQELYSNIAAGNKVVLLGRDAGNVSKDNSPFGPANHYVLATGLDRQGNVVVNDPELRGPRAYNPSILNSVSYGVATSRRRSGGRSGISSRSKFGRFIKRISGGASKEECLKFITTIGPIIQKYAKARGYKVASAVIAQACLESGWNGSKLSSKYYNYFGMKCGSKWKGGSVNMSTKEEYTPGTMTTISDNFRTYRSMEEGVAGYYDFINNDHYKALKSAKTPQEYLQALKNAGYATASDYVSKNMSIVNSYGLKEYDDFSKVHITASDLIAAGAAGSDGVSSESDDSSSSSGGIGKYVTAVTNAFSNAFNAFFNGTGDSSSSSSTSSSSSSGDGDSDVAVDAITGPGNKTQKALAAKMLSKEGKLTYSMEGPRDPDKGSADCSSTVNWAYRKVTGKDVGGYTDAMLHSSNTEIIDIANNISKTAGVTNGSGPNIDKLMPGDIMLYSRPNSAYNRGWDYRNGHVEMYIGNGKRIGHGGGIGPKVSDAKKNSENYIMAKRLKGITKGDKGKGGMPSNVPGGSGSWIIPSYSDIANVSGGSSGLLLSKRIGGNKGMNASVRSMEQKKHLSGGDSSISAITTNALNNIARSARVAGDNGSISKDKVAKLIDAITNLLSSIANNTADITNIYNILKNTNFGSLTTVSGGGSQQNSKSTTNVTPIIVNNSKSSSDEVDSNIISLVSVLSDIAKG